jgi:hypothetical protein
MTYQEPTNRPRTSTHPSLLFFGALVVAVTIIAIITLFNALNRGPIERTGTGSSTTQPAPNTGAAR